MQEQLIRLADSYKKTGDALHDAIRDSIVSAGGFINAANNKGDKPDMTAMVFDSGMGVAETFPIEALRVNEMGTVEIYVGNYDGIYTDRYLRGKGSEEHWTSLKDSGILFYQTALSIASHIDEYIQ